MDDVSDELPEKIELTRDQVERLPIFPLPGVQMFPHALLPLHVFEPRYRMLVRDCMTQSGLMGVALLEPGYESEYEGRPPVFNICGVGRIIAHEPLADGRSNILLQGVARVRILSEWPPKEEPYRVVRADLLADLSGPEDQTSERTLRILTQELAAKIPSGGDVLKGLLDAQTDLGALTDVLAGTLVLDPDDRQKLLETLQVGERAERLCTHLAQVIGQVARQGSKKTPPQGGQGGPQGGPKGGQGSSTSN